MDCIDGKCNQLQKDLHSLESTVITLRNDLNVVTNMHRELLEGINKACQPSRETCYVDPKDGIMQIYGYKVNALKFLIGINGRTKKQIENTYKIHIKIPERDLQPQKPVEIYYRHEGCIYSYIWGTEHVLKMLKKFEE